MKKSSLDLLLTLVNVVRGEMSVVGPSPVLPGEAKKYGRYLDTCCSVKPGLVGLAQIYGTGDFRHDLALDVLCVRKRGWRLTLHVLAGCIPAVLFRRGSC